MSSETESRIEAVLDKFENDVIAVREQLKILSSPVSIDSISATKPDSHKAVPYAMSAYALSSLLFAYLRSEGKDTAAVMPELSRVKEKMEKLGKQLSGSAEETQKMSKKESKQESKKESKKESRKSRSVSPEVDSKKANKHTRFSDSDKEKSKKKIKKTKGSNKD